MFSDEVERRFRQRVAKLFRRIQPGRGDDPIDLRPRRRDDLPLVASVTSGPMPSPGIRTSCMKIDYHQRHREHREVGLEKRPITSVLTLAIRAGQPLLSNCLLCDLCVSVVQSSGAK